MMLALLCVQEGAMDLLRELKGFNMTLKLLQVGLGVFAHSKLIRNNGGLQNKLKSFDCLF